ncbi:MAG TPA: DJ-1/PfpI family protein [Hyphomicrobiaceae bacterium]|nr:DJ-1/PfpI family protein [Hyphomicrobiaceae bacterium]
MTDAVRHQIGLILFPRLTQLDLTGPFEVLARLPNADVHLVWKDLQPVVSDVGLKILPTRTLTDCPKLDVICIPGGPGMNALLEDDEMLAFVRDQGGQARYVTSVCTGALVLGAAGLLHGYKAATHWASMQFLEAFGATPVNTRVCIDRNRITGGGVTAGIDFGLLLAEALSDRLTAEKIQLYMEYNPQPPFAAGSPDTAPPIVVSEFRSYVDGMLKQRGEAVARAAQKLTADPSF